MEGQLIEVMVMQGRRCLTEGATRQAPKQSRSWQAWVHLISLHQEQGRLTALVYWMYAAWSHSAFVNARLLSEFTVCP